MKHLRKEYTQSTLDITSADKDPIVQFDRWFTEAVVAEVLEPNAMNLATISNAGRPASRIVLLKGVEKGRFLFFTNYQSHKGHDLEKNPACALNFFWPQLERQVRITGVAERIDEKSSEAYFQSRPRTSQVSAWASPQSTPISNRSILEGRVQEIEERFKGKEVLPKPHQWGGFAVEPLEIEFWQGRENRLHDRIVYTRTAEGWKTIRLAP